MFNIRAETKIFDFRAETKICELRAGNKIFNLLGICVPARSAEKVLMYIYWYEAPEKFYLRNPQ